jgi:hypothetical protein
MSAGTVRRPGRGCGQWDPSGDGVTLSWSDVSVYTVVKETLGFFRRPKWTYKRIINNGKGDTWAHVIKFKINSLQLNEFGCLAVEVEGTLLIKYAIFFLMSVYVYLH